MLNLFGCYLSEFLILRKMMSPEPKTKWYDYECETICNVKNQAIRKMLQTYTRSNREDFKQKRKEEYNLTRKKKRQQLKGSL